MQTVVGQFPRISFLSISFLSISCTAMLPFLDKIPILCEAHHLLSPKLSGKLLSITYQDSFHCIYSRWALLCLLWFPWLFHTLSMILKPPAPLSLFTFNRWESRSHHSLYIHSTTYWREVLCFSPSISAKRKHFFSFSPAVHHQLWVPTLICSGTSNTCLLLSLPFTFIFTLHHKTMLPSFKNKNLLLKTK